MSFEVSCEARDEIDYYWERLSDGGEEGPCGWLTDRFGVSWQVTPIGLEELPDDADPQRAERTMAAMLQMGKLDIAATSPRLTGPGST